MHWGDVIEDFLEPAGLSFADFRDEMTGGWMFNYIEALRLVGIRTVLVCISRGATAPTRLVHRPTGTAMLVLPPARPYALLRGATVGWRSSEPVSGIRRRTYRSSRARLASYIATPVRSLMRELRREGCDIILCQEYDYPRFDVCVMLGGVSGRAVFASYQGGVGAGTALERALRRRAINRSAGVIVPTSAEQQRVQERYGLDPAKTARIFNPVDLSMWFPDDRRRGRQELGIDSAARVAVWHGRVKLLEKGLDVLVEAWERVCGERPGRDLRLVLVGTGDDSEELRRRIAERELRGITWIDRYVLDRPAMRRYLSAGDVHVLPSRQEGLPVSILEAMACGLPVVAADASGVPDVFEDGELSGGIVVPRGDAEALARELGALLDDGERARELGERARRRVERRFSLEAVGPQLRGFFLGEDGSGGPAHEVTEEHS